MQMEWKKLLSPVRVRDFFIEPGSPKVDHRTEFERDYDRAVFSTPVRRLADKAQVFPLEPNDSVRTRLIHSLEVSTVARDMARTIETWLKEKGETSQEIVNSIETIAATCGLIHDLGNPPFGHAGEIAIREWFQKRNDEFWKMDEDKKSQFGQIELEQLKKDFCQFEGNAQTLRLVSKLQVLSDMFGLNLTCGTMSAAIKYIMPSHRIDKKYHENKKVGYFASEELLVNLIQKETGTENARNPITYIVEAADDIVYSVVDLEDGVKKGVIDWNSLGKKLESSYNGNKEILKKYFKSARKIINKKGYIKLQGKSYGEAMAQAFRIVVIGTSVAAVIQTFKDKYPDIMKGNYHGELYEDSEAFSLIKTCKDVGTKHVYRSHQNLELEVMGRHIIHDLMDIFWEGALEGESEGKEFKNKIFSLISRNYRTVFENATKKPQLLKKHKVFAESSGLLAKYPLPRKYCCILLLTDYICGMTDSFACSLHKRLTNG